MQQETYPRDSISPEGWGSRRQRARGAGRGGAEPKAQQCSGPHLVEKNALNSATSSSMLSTRPMGPQEQAPALMIPGKGAGEVGLASDHPQQPAFPSSPIAPVR